MNDKELLELAAKAAGIHICHTWLSDEGRAWSSIWVKDKLTGADTTTLWNPLGNDGCALRLAVKLRLQLVIYPDWVEVLQDGIRITNADSVYDAGCMFSCARRAIVRAAAEIGRSMP